MTYTKQQINAAIDATSAMCFILHVNGAQFCDAVRVAMQLSHDQNGQLSDEDKTLITELMP